MESRMPSLLTVLVALALTLSCGTNQLHAAEDVLDIERFTLTFEENFDDLDVSPWGQNGSRWISHTPWNGDFGDAKFADPEPGFPFTIEKGVLRIEARKGIEGQWRSGLLAAVNPSGVGFSQVGGYFEARMKLPAGLGVWPAFWLIGVDRSQFTAEIDVLEHYGHIQNSFSSKYHVWRKVVGKESTSVVRRTNAPNALLTDAFNTYGVNIEGDTLTFYFNRRKIWQTSAPPEFIGVKFYPLVNLALGSGWSIDNTPNPSFLYVDYIHVYSIHNLGPSTGNGNPRK